MLNVVERIKAQVPERVHAFNVVRPVLQKKAVASLGLGPATLRDLVCNRVRVLAESFDYFRGSVRKHAAEKLSALRVVFRSCPPGRALFRYVWFDYKVLVKFPGLR